MDVKSLMSLEECCEYVFSVGLAKEKGSGRNQAVSSQAPAPIYYLPPLARYRIFLLPARLKNFFSLGSGQSLQ